MTIVTIATIVTIVGSVTAFLQQTFYLGRSSINILGTPCYVRSRALRSANDGERIALGLFHLPGFFGRQLEITVSRGFYLSLQSESSDYLSVLRWYFVAWCIWMQCWHPPYTPPHLYILHVNISLPMKNTSDNKRCVCATDSSDVFHKKRQKKRKGWPACVVRLQT